MEENFEPEKFYHVYNHAIGIENLFRKEENYPYFLNKFAQYISPVADTFAYCLMPNHFHFLIRVKSEAELLAHYNHLVTEKAQNPQVFDEQGLFMAHTFVMLQFQHFLNGYTQAYNKSFKRKGGLFLHNLNRKEVTNDTYFTTLVHYIHFNPVHHGFCRQVHEWTFSSYHSFLSNKETKLSRQEVLQWFGGVAPFRTFHDQKPDSNFSPDFD
jgi:REP element-mobilizing transposase RayT